MTSELKTALTANLKVAKALGQSYNVTFFQQALDRLN